MVTGAAAEQAAQREVPKPKDDSKDRGAGSVAGNLVADPELRYTSNGRPVSNLRLATSERIRDEKTGEWKDGPTAFYDIQCWGNLAENVAEHLQRGDRVVAEGRWMETSYENKENVIVTRLYLQARDLGPSMIFRGARPVRQQDGK